MAQGLDGFNPRTTYVHLVCTHIHTPNHNSVRIQVQISTGVQK